jgi:hypothetical protein
MKSPTKSPYWGRASRLRQVDLDPSHYRVGRWLLLAQGLVLIGLGVAGLRAGVGHPRPAGGAQVLMLRLTPLHAGALLAFGLLVVAAIGSRRATTWATAVSLLAAMLAFTIGVTAATDGPAGPWGLDFGDAWLHAVVMVVDLALLVWLLPDELQDPAWMPRRRPSPRDPDHPSDARKERNS